MKRLLSFPTALAFAANAFAAGTATFTSVADSATTPDLSANPERGWYLHSELTSWCDGHVATWAGGGHTSYPGQRFALFYYEVSGASNDATVNENLACARSIGVKAIFAVSYCSAANCNEGKTLSQIQSDIASYKNVWEANKDVIAFVKITAIGAFGEWASWQGSTPVPANVKAGIITAFLNAVPRTIPVLLRNPPHLREIYNTPLAFSQWMRNSDEQARIGLFNDGFGGGSDDRSTYPGPNSTVFDPPYTASATQQRAYARAMTNYSPFVAEPEAAGSGGVTRNHCDSRDSANDGLPSGIMNDGPGYHVVSMHRAYNEMYHTQWIAEGCFPRINNLMGYRVQLDNISHATTVARGTTLRVTVNMRNVGWARIFSQRRLNVTLDNGTTAITGIGSVQLRQLPPQATGSTPLYVDVPIPAGAATGSYSVYLSIPDVYTGAGQSGTLAKFNVRFANADATGQTWDGAKGRISTNTSVTVN